MAPVERTPECTPPARWPPPGHPVPRLQVLLQYLDEELKHVDYAPLVFLTAWHMLVGRDLAEPDNGNFERPHHWPSPAT